MDNKKELERPVSPPPVRDRGRLRTSSKPPVVQPEIIMESRNLSQELLNLGIFVKYLIKKDDVIDMLVAITCKGNLVIIKSNLEGYFEECGRNVIVIKSKENSNIPSSWLHRLIDITSTQAAFIYKKEFCVFSKNNSGAVGVSNYDIIDHASNVNIITLNVYPTINMSEILTVENVNNREALDELLDEIDLYDKDLNRFVITDLNKEVKELINVLKVSTDNLEILLNILEDFDSNNNSELNIVSEEMSQELKKKPEKINQMNLRDLERRMDNLLTNRQNSLLCLQNCEEQKTLYQRLSDFSLECFYNFFIESNRTFESEESLIIRNPSTWFLDEELSKTAKLYKNSKNVSYIQAMKAINEDIRDSEKMTMKENSHQKIHLLRNAMIKILSGRHLE